MKRKPYPSSMPRQILLTCSLAATVALAACIANAPSNIQRETQASGGAGASFGVGGSNATTTITGPDTSDPHATLGADPPHGAFSGGQRVVVAGKGFTEQVRVWFGDVEADPADVIAINPTQVQVNTPPQDPGEVDLTTQNGDDESTRRTLVAGYTYDPLYADPDNGPIAGGTVIIINGKNGQWDQTFQQARIDQKPCTTIEVLGPDQLRCTVPLGTQGTKSISVTTSSEVLTALDAYTYQDSEDGFKGGLGGDPIAGTLRVLVYDNFSGQPIPAAHVIAGPNLSTGIYQQTDSTGVTLFSGDPLLDAPVTVTATAECHSPISFVDVPVDTVTVYLDPVLTPQCVGSGDPPPGGGNPVQGGLVTGELVWPSVQEFQKGAWVNIPAADAGEERIAYLYLATRNPKLAFSTAPTAMQVDENDPGEIGYGFSFATYPGNHHLYALAGLRNIATNQFTAYAMGVAKGVAVLPGAETASVLIPMDHALDQALSLDATPPAPGAKGPARLDARVVIELAKRAYAIVPSMQKTPLLPLQAPVSFIGLPGLDGDLTGARYITSAEAVTGPTLAAPLSVVSAVATTTTSIPVDVTGFVAIPALQSPAVNTSWDGSNLSVQYPTGGFPADMTVYEILGGGGLMRWLVAVPAAAHAIELPDLSGFADAHLPSGSLLIGVYGARIDDFDYGQIGYVNLRPQGMSAYSLDVFNVHLP